MPLKIPTRLADNCHKTPERTGWLDGLSALLSSLVSRWSLTVLDPFDCDEGSCAWVAPVIRADGSRAVLKLGMPHMEARDEVQGLRFWNGNPTVELFAGDADLGASLMERCEPGTALRLLPEAEQDEVIAGLLRRLWRPVPPGNSFRPLSALTGQWSSETLAAVERWPDDGLVREGLRIFDELSRPGPLDVLLATDLHAGNVLRSQREPWLVIDPKPFAGDPTYDATQHLLNCDLRLRMNPDSTIRRFADLSGLDHRRVRLWLFARAAADPRGDWHNDDCLALARTLRP
jgi:streptomycin 6-kinase